MTYSTYRKESITYNNKLSSNTSNSSFTDMLLIYGSS